MRRSNGASTTSMPMLDFDPPLVRSLCIFCILYDVFFELRNLLQTLLLCRVEKERDH